MHKTLCNIHLLPLQVNQTKLLATWSCKGEVHNTINSWFEKFYLHVSREEFEAVKCYKVSKTRAQEVVLSQNWQGVAQVRHVLPKAL